ncbi:MAG: hypothetical protein HYY06_24120 [Deltaproteobacteria bacterium]|nr:hypothetical protein [Deltaproteobacteria bacterium]
MGSKLLAAIGLAAMLWPGEAGAQTSSPLIRRIEQLYLDSSYDEVLRESQAALRNPRLAPEERQEILKYMGTVYFAQDNTSEARSAFVRILRNDPAYRLPADWPPRIVEFFERLRGELLPPPRIRHEPPLGFRLGQPIVVPAQILFLADNHRPRLHYRIRGGRGYSVVDMDREENDLYSGVVPASLELSPDHDTIVEYFITVEDGGRVVASAGSQAEPLGFPVGRIARTNGRNGPHPPPAKTPWMLIGLGAAVAVGLGVGAYFIVSSSATEETGAVDISWTAPD